MYPIAFIQDELQIILLQRTEHQHRKIFLWNFGFERHESKPYANLSHNYIKINPQKPVIKNINQILCFFNHIYKTKKARNLRRA